MVFFFTATFPSSFAFVIRLQNVSVIRCIIDVYNSLNSFSAIMFCPNLPVAKHVIKIIYCTIFWLMLQNSRSTQVNISGSIRLTTVRKNRKVKIHLTSPHHFPKSIKFNYIYKFYLTIYHRD